ncbi:hypothetical protein [Bacillus cihuensis]|uniref:hypothetical protein n=1 Tax=Bacillus cihuensis TaxID=1208599 RepID=UPI000410A000|nr:hypothetical protein [Bacillus cihuensis]
MTTNIITLAKEINAQEGLMRSIKLHRHELGLIMNESDVLYTEADLILKTITDEIKMSYFIGIIGAVHQFNENSRLPFKIHHSLKFKNDKIEIESHYNNNHITSIVECIDYDLVVNGKIQHMFMTSDDVIYMIASKLLEKSKKMNL